MKEYKLNKQHEKFMLSAGFIADPAWNKDNYFNIHYWRRGDISLVFAKNESISLDEFTKRLILQTEYRVKKLFQPNFIKIKDSN